jgi:hypothetical protein
MISDPGDQTAIYGAHATSRSDSPGSYNPEDVDFFYFLHDNPFNNLLVDHIEGDPDIVLLFSGTSPALSSGAFMDVGWAPVVRRYVGLRVTTNYETVWQRRHLRARGLGAILCSPRYRHLRRESSRYRTGRNGGDSCQKSDVRVP